MIKSPYHVLVSKTAEKQINKLPLDIQQKVASSLVGLSIDPFPYGVRKLSGFDDVYRIRLGTYRILYSVQGKTITITILKVGHRKDIYRVTGQHLA